MCIECKSGEFRESIDKYVDLTDQQARGLSAMYGLTFVNEQGLAPHLQGLLG